MSFIQVGQDINGGAANYQEQSKIILTQEKFPIINIEGNVIGYTGTQNVFKENNLVENVTDLKNKIFLGFNNIIGITQQNIFHNIDICNTKIFFHKYNENSIYTNDKPWLIDISNDIGQINYNNFINYIDNLENQNIINLYDYFYKESYNVIFNDNNIIFNPSNIVYKLNKISEYTPLQIYIINNGKKTYIQYGTEYWLDNTNIYFNNNNALTQSLQIELYFDIYYDNNLFVCSNNKWSKEYLLLNSNILLTHSILVNNQIPTNQIIFLPPPEVCCPKKAIHNPAHKSYTLGQLASKKIQKYQQIEFSRNRFSIQLAELNFTNRCAPRFIEQNIDVSINKNNSNKCRHAPKNKF